MAAHPPSKPHVEGDGFSQPHVLHWESPGTRGINGYSVQVKVDGPAGDGKFHSLLADTKSKSTKAEEMCLGDSEKEIQAGRSRILAQSTLDGSCRRLDDAANDGPPRRIAAWGLLPIWTNESPLTAGRPPRRK